MDEVFGKENEVNFIIFQKTSSSTSENLGNVADYLLWYAKKKDLLKFRKPLYLKKLGRGHLRHTIKCANLMVHLFLCLHLRKMKGRKLILLGSIISLPRALAETKEKALLLGFQLALTGAM